MNPLFKPVPGDKRLTAFPIGRPDIYQYYDRAVACQWTVNEVDLSKDKKDYERLTPGEQHFIKHVLAFFAVGDAIVNENLTERFEKEIDIIEAKYFYHAQMAMEDIHAIMYSMLLVTIIPSEEERTFLLNSTINMPIIGKMRDFIVEKCIKSNDPFAARILRMACVEGIFFTGCFCVIYWLQNRKLMPGLGHSNQLIARDEGLHTEFALHLYNLLEPEHKLNDNSVYQVFKEAVAIAQEFIHEALPIPLEGMNAMMMCDYIESQADVLLGLINLPPLFGKKHDFLFMQQINMANKTNFFERRVSEYSKPLAAPSGEYTILSDF